MAENIDVIKGNTKSIVVTVVNSSGEAYDLAGCTCEFTVRTMPFPGIEVLDMTAAAEDISTNTVTFDLTAAVTDDIIQGPYLYEVRVTDGVSVQTVATGLFNSINSLFIVP